MLSKIFGFLFGHKTVAPVVLSYQDQELQLAEARKAEVERMKEAAKKAALIKQLNAEAAAFDAISMAIKVAEDLADAEDLGAEADKKAAIFNSMMADPKSAIAAVRAARQAKNNKTNP